MPSDESKGSQLDAIGSLAQRQLDNTDTKSGTVHVELSLDDAESFPSAIESSSRGTVEIAVERISPAALVLRAKPRPAPREATGSTVF